MAFHECTNDALCYIRNLRDTLRGHSFHASPDMCALIEHFREYNLSPEKCFEIMDKVADEDARQMAMGEQINKVDKLVSQANLLFVFIVYGIYLLAITEEDNAFCEEAQNLVYYMRSGVLEYQKKIVMLRSEGGISNNTQKRMTVRAKEYSDLLECKFQSAENNLYWLRSKTT